MRNAVKLRAQFDLRGDRRGRWGEDEAEMVICNLTLGHLIVLHQHHHEHHKALSLHQSDPIFVVRTTSHLFPPSLHDWSTLH